MRAFIRGAVCTLTLSVSSDRFWWLKLKALTELKDWDGLEAFAKSKRSPIGYEPFVVSGNGILLPISSANHSRMQTHLLAVKQPARAVVFVPRCDAKNRVELYVKCDDWAKAAAEVRGMVRQ